LVAKKFDILKPLVTTTCNRSSVGVNICVQLSIAINPVGRYRLIAMPLQRLIHRCYNVIATVLETLQIGCGIVVRESSSMPMATARGSKAREGLRLLSVGNPSLTPTQRRPGIVLGWRTDEASEAWQPMRHPRPGSYGDSTPSTCSIGARLCLPLLRQGHATGVTQQDKRLHQLHGTAGSRAHPSTPPNRGSFTAKEASRRFTQGGRSAAYSS
jgi:hypothetical protein